MTGAPQPLELPQPPSITEGPVLIAAPLVMPVELDWLQGLMVSSTKVGTILQT